MKDVSFLLDALRLYSKIAGHYRRWALDYASAILSTVGKSFDDTGPLREQIKYLEKPDRLAD